jgi:hypothetical protein
VLTASRSAVDPNDQRRQSYLTGCDLLPMSGAGLAVVGCTSCSAERESHPGSIASTLYREEGLGVRKRRKRGIVVRAPILMEARPNSRWSLDFLHDHIAHGRRFRVLNVPDYNQPRMLRRNP